MPTRHLIEDPAAFARRLREGIAAKRYPTLNAAAKDIKVPQPVLHRLANARQASIRSGTYKRLKPLLGKGAAERAELLAPYAQAALAAWEKWLADELARIGNGKSDQEARERRAELEALRLRLSRDPILAKLEQHILRRSNQNEFRAALVLHRIFEPFLQARAAGWIERNAWELTAAEFRSFVRAAWKKEQIILRREGKIRRAQMSDLLRSQARMSRIMPARKVVIRVRRDGELRTGRRPIRPRTPFQLEIFRKLSTV